MIGTGGEQMMHMPLTLFICGRSRAVTPTSSLARRPPIIEDLRNARWEAGPILAPWAKRFRRVTARGCVFRCVYSEIEAWLKISSTSSIRTSFPLPFPFLFPLPFPSQTSQQEIKSPCTLHRRQHVELQPPVLLVHPGQGLEWLVSERVAPLHAI